MAIRKLSLLVVAIACCYHSSRLAAAIPELDMRSAYLYNFAQFADWPSNDQPTFNICTLDKVAESISPEVLANKTVNGKKIKLSRFSESADTAECQMVYLNTADIGYAAKIARMLSTEHVLTVGEDSSGNGLGIINLSVKNNRLVFDLDLAKARKANISLSSKLIQLAQKVRE
ncbi:MAG TPA: YfiR family protein [Methylophilus sp.]|uniref:YfiR family protein n=1 Tax=Methylophilus sp. TaxID=29541 RepID=UPI002BF7EA18|nr:YfiR family protein [Methylophilus sp.]HSH87605.1 YfiR family protein [Methylophilus sp.]